MLNRAKSQNVWKLNIRDLYVRYDFLQQPKSPNTKMRVIFGLIRVRQLFVLESIKITYPVTFQQTFFSDAIMLIGKKEIIVLWWVILFLSLAFFVKLNA